MASQPSGTSRFLRGAGLILILILIGGLFGCLGGWAWASGRLVPWRALPALPESAAHIAALTIDSVDAAGVSGRFYRYDLGSPQEGWLAVEQLSLPGPDESTPEACQSLAERAPAFRGESERRFTCIYYADASFTTIFALRDGRIHYWRESSSGYAWLFLMILCPLSGALLGLLAGGLLLLVRRNRS